MSQIVQVSDRRTNVDVIFDHLHDRIVTLGLLPGDKISETEIATLFGVSRQPVRDAFSRLEHLDLLMIRPQRATEVRRFSSRQIMKSRFVRAALELEVARRASERCDAKGITRLDAALASQRAAIADGDLKAFGTLDYAFHKTLCDIARLDFAYDVISVEKAKVDRLCILSLSKADRMPQLYEDHRSIADAVGRGQIEEVMAATQVHLSRLDATIEEISETNPGYFDP